MGSAAGAGKAAGPPDRWPFALEGHVTGSEAFAKAFIAPRACEPLYAGQMAMSICVYVRAVLFPVRLGTPRQSHGRRPPAQRPMIRTWWPIASPPTGEMTSHPRAAKPIVPPTVVVTTSSDCCSQAYCATNRSCDDEPALLVRLC